MALARTLASDPCVILADEPTGNLDSETRNQVLSFFDAFHKAGKTILIVTHDPSAASHAGRIIHLDIGTLREPAFIDLRKAA